MVRERNRKSVHGFHSYIVHGSSLRMSGVSFMMKIYFSKQIVTAEAQVWFTVQ